MKRHLLAGLVLALSCFIGANALEYKPLTDLSKLSEGDKVVITMVYDGVVYGLNGYNATSDNPKSDTLELNSAGALEDPDASYIFIASSVGEDGWNFALPAGKQLYIVKSGNAVRVSTPGATAGTVWKLHPVHHYLYSVIPSSTDTFYLGVYHKEGALDHCKKFTHYAYSKGSTSGWKTIINDETFALYVYSPTGDPNKEKHDITPDLVAGGTISVPYPKAAEGAGIPIELTPAKGYDYVEGSLRIVYNDGIKDITVYATDGQFVMPNYPVTVTAEFEGRAPELAIDFTAPNRWGLPDARTKTKGTYTYNGNSIEISCGTSANDGYYWIEAGGGHLLMGKKNAVLRLPVFTKDIAKIVVTGNGSAASAKTVMNILVDGSPVSKETVGSEETNTYVIAPAARVAGTVYDLTILSDDAAQITGIDIYAAVPGAPEMPTVDVSEGLYTTPQSVQLACETAGADIHYTVDGSRPTELSPLYSGAITVDHTITIKAVAINAGVKSEIMTASYAIANVAHIGTANDPYSVEDVQQLGNPGLKAWVHGYIIDGFEPNITIRELSSEAKNAIAIADLATETDKLKMVFVELPQGKIRNALNVVDNDVKGKEVWVYGVLSSYGGQNGVTKTSKYSLDTAPVTTGIDNIAEPAQRTEAPVKILHNGHLYIIYSGEVYDITGRRL